MAKSVRCIITDCKSNALTDLNIKFFRFPPRDTRLYTVWEDICFGSVNAIRKVSRPFICSKHFRDRDVGVRRLSHNAVPVLNLNNPPRCIVDHNPTLDSALTPEQVQKTRLVRLLNDAVVEWAKRSDYYSLMSIPKSDLIKVATKIRKLLGPKLTLSLDNYWCNKLRSRFCRVEPYNRSFKRCGMLDLEQIIKELDLTVKIYKDTEATEESEKSAEGTKSQLEKRPCYYRPKVKEGEPGTLKCDTTTKPTKAKNNDEIVSPKFNGKKYVKKTKTQTSTELNISASTQIECSVFDLKKEPESDDCSKASVLDEVSSSNIFLEQEKTVPPNCSIGMVSNIHSEIIQSKSKMENISQEIIKGKFIERVATISECSVFKTSDEVIDLTQSDPNIAEVNPLKRDIAPSAMRFKGNVLQEKVASSSGNKKNKTEPSNISQAFLKNHLSYIYNYDQPKPKLSIPLVSKCPDPLKKGNEPRRSSSKTSNPDNDDKIQSKKQKFTSRTEFTKNDNRIFKTNIKQKDSLVENEYVEVNKSHLNDSQLNVKTKKNGAFAVNLSSDPSFAIQPDVDDMNQLAENNNDKDVLCFDGYWSSDDSAFDQGPQSKIASYMKALDYLKPLEDFVLRKENFRAIGLVSNLEIHFKRQALLQDEKI